MNINKDIQDLSFGNMWAKYKGQLLKAWFLSVLANLLSLMPSLYMLQVYDRVINSRSMTTLLMLTMLVIGAYILMELLEWVKSEIFKKVAMDFEGRNIKRVFILIFNANLRKTNTGGAQPITDLRTLREFCYSPALFSIIELPLVPVYLFLIFLINPVLVYLATIAALMQLLITWLTEKRTYPAFSEANKSAIAAQQYANGSLRNGQVIESMGMIHGIHNKWMEYQFKFLNYQAIASDYAGTLTVTSKVLQQLVSSAMLGLGCWLFLQGDLADGGMMIVASILGGKVLQPLVVLLSNWRQIVNARDAYQRLRELLLLIPAEHESMPLPPPKGKLDVENLTASAPGSNVPILKNISFTLNAGECLAIVGPSAAGKTTLVRLLIGIWPALSGKVRLDGADIYEWNKSELGPHLGYLPQNVELFEGTLAENITRFGEPDLAALNNASQLAGLQQLIENFPEGFNQPIGNEGAFLSGGQRQRIGLARAIYKMPRLIILDEPNANLDAIGDNALHETIANLKSSGRTVIVVSHRPQILNSVDKILVLVDGTIKLFGDKNEVLEVLSKSRPQKEATFSSSSNDLSVENKPALDSN